MIPAEAYLRERSVGMRRAFASRRAAVIPNKSRLISIQILRAVAAFGVMSTHLWWDLVAPNSIFGTFGVDLFFVISGFIMVYVSESLFGQKTSPATFFVRRVVRIVPLYWMITLAILIGGHSLGLAADTTWLNVTGSFLFFPTTHPDGGTGPVLLVGWTLNYEMFFYVVFAIATLLSRKIAVIAVTMFFLVVVIVPRLFRIPLDNLFGAFWCNPMVFEFAFGMWIALIFREGLRISRWVSYVLIAAGLALLILTYFYNFFGFSDFATLGRVTGWGGSAAIIVAAVVLADVKPATSPIWMGLAFLGDASYALYLVHTLIPNFLFWVPWLIEPAGHAWLDAAILASAAVGLAIIVHLTFERPVTAFLHRKTEPFLARLPC